MVSFRFHLVSLVAVFLALGLGILTGTTVINRGIVRQLRDQTARFTQRANQAEGQVSVLNDFGEAVMGHVIEDRLAGVEVVIVTQQGTDEGAIATARRSLERGGAEVLGLLTVSERMALPDEPSRNDLGAIVGDPPTTDADVLIGKAAQDMATELAFGSGAGDVLPELIRQEFVLVGGREVGDSLLRSLEGSEAVVMVAGGPDEPVVDPERFMVPLAEGLVEEGERVMAAEGLVNRHPFVTLLREDAAVNGEVATQDNVDQVPGEVGLVLGVENLIQGSPGHYGVKAGATNIIPPP